MPTENVLVQVNSAANLSGFQALQSALSMSNLSLLGLGVALGVLGEAFKSSIENTEAMEKAHLSLRQAASVTGESFGDLQSKFDDWAQANKGYIADQYDAETALAAFVRAGNSEKDALRLLNDALDLSVIKHESVSDAEKTLELALSGSGKGLRDLGITTDEYNSIMHNKLLSTEQKHLALLALIEGKTKDARDATTPLSKAQQALNLDWQDLSTKAGPKVVEALSLIIKGIDDAYQALQNLSKDDALWANLSGKLTGLASEARALALYLGIAGTDKTVAKDYDRESGPGYVKPATGTPKTITKGSRAAGGPVGDGDYLVGENGPEIRHFGAPGSILPNRGGVYIDLRGAFVPEGAALDRFINMIAQRISYTTGM